jgi:hypothetical protein
MTIVTQNHNFFKEMLQKKVQIDGFTIGSCPA